MIARHFRTFARYNAWANARLYAACDRLTDEAYFAERPAFVGSIHRSLNHILVGDRSWLGRITGVPAGIPTLDTVLHEDRAALRAAREAEDARIVVDAYGDGPRPRIVNGAYQNLKFTGSYTTARNLSLGYTDLDETSCGQPIGDVFAVNFTGGAHHNTIAESDIWGATAGAHLGRESTANRVIHNEIHDNVVKKSEEADPALDLGAWGVLVVSDDNEVAYNTLRDNVAVCRNQGAPPSSNSVELFEGSGNRIHHNWSYGDRAFSELGSSDTEVASDNRWDYNLMVSDLDDAVFLITRGEGGEFGPVFGTTATHNTVFLTGERSDAVVCGNGCGPDVLTLTGNVLDATRKAIFSDAVFPESHNVYWSSTGTPTIQSPIVLHPTSAIVDPGFADPAGLDLRPGPGSPLIDAAGPDRTHDEDLDRAPVDDRPDIGAYERPGD